MSILKDNIPIDCLLFPNSHYISTAPFIFHAFGILKLTQYEACFPDLFRSFAIQEKINLKKQTVIMMHEHPFAQFHFCPKCGSPRFVEHNEKSKQCEDCGFVYYFNPSAATVAVILNERQELLACRRGKEPVKGTLDLPGGFSDCFESSEEGVAREVKEETGLEVTRTEFLFSLPNTYLYSGFLVHTVDCFFRCTVADSSLAHAMDDAAELLWIPVKELCPEDFGLASVRKGIEKLLAQWP